ncbi:MAG TPA: zf-HC2 domain-containing protein [Verrucomicrobiae bacterium]|nr:zf-HC2 domain-containing protein [Verrucomicrobiae bacterium]
MKPCQTNRKLIAWLALDALDTRTAAALREHIALCGSCRRYWEEISRVKERLAVAKPTSDIQASKSFYQRVAEKLEAYGGYSIGENLTASIRGVILNWRLALPATVALLIAAFALVILWQPPRQAPSAPPEVQVTSAPGSESDLAPTLANYQMIAGQSLGKLDDVLTEQGNKALPPAPMYTASTFRLANPSF